MFMEQIRLIKEMRERDRRDGRTGSDVFPRFMVWENVFGAFSSNNGEDFRAVLEETVRIAEPTAVIPRYEGGRWTNAGVIIGNGFSVGWRTHDAQYWGVPQRRRRISLVADFGGESAPEILFESESLSGDSAESGEAREGTAGNAETCAYPAVAGTLKARYDGSPNPDIKSGQEIVVQERGVGIKCLNPDDSQSERVYDETGIWHSLSANSKGGQSRDAVFAFKLGNGAKARSIGLEEELAPTLNAECGGNKPAICIQGNCIDRADSAGCNGRGWRDDDISYTLNTIDRPVVMAFSQNGSGDTTVHPKCNAITANQNPSGRGTAMIFGFQPQAGGNTACAIMEDAAPCLGTTQKPAVYDARGNGDGETAPTITGDHYGHVNDYMAVCVGNGQSDNTKLHELCPALSTMHDQQAVMVSSAGGTNEEIAGTLDASYYKGVGARNGNERTVVAVGYKNEYEKYTKAGDEILRILRETYGEKTVVEWGAAVVDSLQSADILRQGVYESGVSRQTEDQYTKLEDTSLPIPEIVAGWLLRDMRKDRKDGCSSQGRELSEQQSGESATIVSELSQHSTQAAKELFTVWRSGKGIRLLQQTLYKIQEIRGSAMGKRSKGGDEMSVVRRLTPLQP